MKSLIGFVLIVIAAVSLIVSAACVYEVWAMRQPVADAATAGLNLVAETLNTTSDALQVASASLQNVDDTLTTVEQTSLSVAQTMSTTRATLGSFSVLMGKDLPASIDSTRTAVRSAQSSALIVDNVLTTLSRIPFVNIQYNPDVPLNVALGNVAKGLDNLPPTFSAIQQNLITTGSGLDQIVTSLNALPASTQQERRNIVEAQKVIARYQSQVDELQRLLQQIRSSLPAVFTAMAAGMTFLFFWLGVLQAQVLLRGLELLRGEQG